MANSPRPLRSRRSGLTLVELLVAVSIIGLLMALLLPSVQQSREAARRSQCLNNFHQMGLALHTYHDSLRSFPPGCIWSTSDPLVLQGWGWAALSLPYLEARPLYDAVDPTRLCLHEVLNSPITQPHLRTYLSVFHCPSDGTQRMVHDYRLLSGFLMGPGAPLKVAPFHPLPGGGGAGVFGIPTTISNYVGVFGDTWQPQCNYSTLEDLRGNGMFGSNSSVRLSDVTDGTSNTMLVGERGYHTFAAAWAGTEVWTDFHTQGLSMVVGTAYYRPNSPANPYNLSCDGVGAAGFSSRHPGGSMFAFADGSVRFIADTIEFNQSTSLSGLGAFQKLARRDDGQPVVEP